MLVSITGFMIHNKSAVVNRKCAKRIKKSRHFLDNLGSYCVRKHWLRHAFRILRPLQFQRTEASNLCKTNRQNDCFARLQICYAVFTLL